MASLLLRHCDQFISRNPRAMERLRYFYAFGALVSLAITWTLTILRLDEPLPAMASVFSVATAANLSLALLILTIGEITRKVPQRGFFTRMMYDWLLWAAVVFTVQSMAAFVAALGFEFYYGVSRRRGINLCVISSVFAYACWIFLLWRTCLVDEAEQRVRDEILLRKQALRNAGA